ncbi:MAG: hypothetical protein AB8H86_12340 [Polyangiales bacterium]
MRGLLAATLLGLMWAVTSPLGSTDIAPQSASTRLMGFALGLYPQEAAERGWRYPPDLQEVRASGARDILLTPSWVMGDITSSTMGPDADTPRDADLLATLEAANRLGLGVSLMPYLRIREAGEGEWRGSVRPLDPNAWWSEYEDFLRHYAALGRGRIKVFVMGSELSSMSGDEWETRWARLAGELRGLGVERLAFVANHDALDLQAPFEFVDVAGVSAYFPVSGDAERAWQDHATRLERFAAEVARPLVIFELGFPSRQGALERPWDHIAGTPVDVEAQALGYRSATNALADVEWLEGLFFWAWYGEGGPHDRSYSPRGKPAMRSVRAFFEGFGETVDTLDGT